MKKSGNEIKEIIKYHLQILLLNYDKKCIFVI